MSFYFPQMPDIPRDADRYRITQRHRETIERKIEAIRSRMKDSYFQREITSICEVKTFLLQTKKSDCYKLLVLKEEVDQEQERIQCIASQGLEAMVRKTGESLQKIGLGSLTHAIVSSPPTLKCYESLYKDLRYMLFLIQSSDESGKKTGHEQLDKIFNRYKGLYHQELKVLSEDLMFWEEGQQMFAELGSSIRDWDPSRERQLLINANHWWNHRGSFFRWSSKGPFLSTDLSNWMENELVKVVVDPVLSNSWIPKEKSPGEEHSQYRETTVIQSRVEELQQEVKHLQQQIASLREIKMFLQHKEEWFRSYQKKMEQWNSLEALPDKIQTCRQEIVDIQRALQHTSDVKTQSTLKKKLESIQHKRLELRSWMQDNKELESIARKIREFLKEIGLDPGTHVLVPHFQTLLECEKFHASLGALEHMLSFILTPDQTKQAAGYKVLDQTLNHLLWRKERCQENIRLLSEQH